jgi:hypothetical protein
MKKIYFSIIITLILISSEAYSQKEGFAFSYSPGYDSLIFDGSNGNINNFINISDECNIKVTMVKGKAYGKIVTTKIETICGQTDTFKTLVYGPLKVGDIVASEDFMRTESFSQVEVMLHNGKNVWLGPSTEFQMGRDYCMGNGIAKLLSGTVHVKGSNDNGTTYVSTERGIVEMTHTEFSVEIIKEGDVITDILRMYEGSVTFKMNMGNSENMKKTEDKGAEMQKLAEDFQNGKISLEEYMKKIQELQKEMTDVMPQTGIIVNAGYESRIVGTGGNPTEPVTFDTNQNRWWEDK